jgi:putative flippase GtrA
LNLRVTRFAIVGAWNTLFGLALFTGAYLVLRGNLGYVAVLTIAQVVAVIQAHATQRLVVWRSSEPYLAELMRFAAVYAAVYAINVLLLTAAVSGLGLPALELQWIIGGALIVATYAVQRGWTFKHRT